MIFLLSLKIIFFSMSTQTVLYLSFSVKLCRSAKLPIRVSVYRIVARLHTSLQIFSCRIKNTLYLCRTKKNISFSSNARTCGVNLKDIFYSTGSMAVIEYWIFFAFFFCFVTPTNIFTLSI